jgi:hypothetical protein
MYPSLLSKNTCPGECRPEALKMIRTVAIYPTGKIISTITHAAQKQD